VAAKYFATTVPFPISRRTIDTMLAWSKTDNACYNSGTPAPVPGNLMNSEPFSQSSARCVGIATTDSPYYQH